MQLTQYGYSVTETVFGEFEVSFQQFPTLRNEQDFEAVFGHYRVQEHTLYRTRMLEGLIGGPDGGVYRYRFTSVQIEHVKRMLASYGMVREYVLPNP